jgi:deoxyribodipyrimidine photo-lyase
LEAWCDGRTGYPAVDAGMRQLRLFNPARQQERFDPGGDYVRRYVPELAEVPDAYLTEPWTMPAEVQEESGCRIGRDYPAPIVDHAQARRGALDRYRV